METMLISALLPAVISLFKDGLGAATRRWIGLSVDDQVKLDNANVARLEALSKLDNPYGTPSQWIVDLRASFRYIAALVLILAGLGLMFYASETDPALVKLGIELAGAPFSFIFGERLMLSLRQGKG